MQILLVEDDQDTRTSVTEFLSELGHVVTPCETAEAALEKQRQTPFPLVVTDIRLPGMDGLALLKAIRQGPFELTTVVLITAHVDIETAVAAVRHGAYDYLQKPVPAGELAALVERVVERQSLLAENQELANRLGERVEIVTEKMRQELLRAQEKLRQLPASDEMVAESQAMKDVIEAALTYHADPSVPVLIEGETGCGKELVSRLIHYGKSGLNQPFIPVNCAAIVGQLFETELFGYDEGTFTGGSRHGKAGKLEAADTGTLLLDEVSELALVAQAKLLRVLENRTFFRVGGNTEQRFNGRIICHSNTPLLGLVAEGTFRRDLYHRLDLGYIRIPPLRERLDDIEPMATRFVMRESTRRRKRFAAVHPETMAMLRNYPWPGNVRELEHVVERAVLLFDADVLLPEHIAFRESVHSKSLTLSSATGNAATSLDAIHLPDDTFDLEAHYLAIVRQALEKFDGNRTQTARYLNLTRRALDSRLRKLQDHSETGGDWKPED